MEKGYGTGRNIEEYLYTIRLQIIPSQKVNLMNHSFSTKGNNKKRAYTYVRRDRGKSKVRMNDTANRRITRIFKSEIHLPILHCNIALSIQI